MRYPVECIYLNALIFIFYFFQKDKIPQIKSIGQYFLTSVKIDITLFYPKKSSKSTSRTSTEDEKIVFWKPLAISLFLGII